MRTGRPSDTVQKRPHADEFNLRSTSGKLRQAHEQWGTLAESRIKPDKFLVINSKMRFNLVFVIIFSILVLEAKSASWTSQCGTVNASPSEILSPASEQEVVNVIKEAALNNVRVKVVGDGHSFSPIASTDGAMPHTGNTVLHGSVIPAVICRDYDEIG
jgi:hypothetical protein